MNRAKKVFFVFCVGLGLSLSYAKLAVASPGEEVCYELFVNCHAGDADSCRWFRTLCHGSV